MTEEQSFALSCAVEALSLSGEFTELEAVRCFRGIEFIPALSKPGANVWDLDFKKGVDGPSITTVVALNPCDNPVDHWWSVTVSVAGKDEVSTYTGKDGELMSVIRFAQTD